MDLPSFIGRVTLARYVSGAAGHPVRRGGDRRGRVASLTSARLRRALAGELNTRRQRCICLVEAFQARPRPVNGRRGFYLGWTSSGDTVRLSPVEAMTGAFDSCESSISILQGNRPKHPQTRQNPDPQFAKMSPPITAFCGFSRSTKQRSLNCGSLRTHGA